MLFVHIDENGNSFVNFDLDYDDDRIIMYIPSDEKVIYNTRYFGST